MTFRIEGAEIALEDHCGIEDAQPLFEALRGVEGPVFDLSRVKSLHTAVIQLILVSTGRVRSGFADSLFLAIFRDRLQA